MSDRNSTRKELLDKLIENLESGKYKHGTEVLRHGDNYCCLGVLCDISGMGQWVALDESYPDYEWVDHNGEKCLYDLSSEPYENAVWIGSIMGLMRKPPGDYSHQRTLSDALTVINDNSETFEPVIEFLKKNYDWILHG